MHVRVGFWLRALGVLLDLLIFAPVLLMMAYLFGALRQWGVIDGNIQQKATLTIWLTWLAYTSTEVFCAGTPGKRLLGMRIRRIDGESAGFWELLLRWETKQLPWILALAAALAMTGLLQYLAGLMNGIIVVGCLNALNESHLSWHDQWSATAVYRQKRTEVAATPILAEHAIA